MDRRRHELDTLRRFARWDTAAPVFGDWVRREGGFGWSDGPVVELELGYRAAAVLIGGRS